MIHKENELKEICNIIRSHSGICVAGAHIDFLCSYVQKRVEELDIECEKYISLLEKSEEELTRLINQSTINETYFFREEKQFAVLKNTIFPLLKDRPVTIWSAACSTGEEILSIAMLCAESNICARLYASDIDSNALEVLKKGEYSKVSVRSDGSVFHSILNKYCASEISNITIENKIKQNIKIGTFNLHTLKGNAEIPIDGTVDIIFLRNVFIYFDEETRNKIISFMEKKLTPHGYLFFSMSEIASINPNKQSSLSKQRSDMVYYLQKGVASEEQKKSVQIKSPKNNEENRKTIKKIEKKEKKHSSTELKTTKIRTSNNQITKKSVEKEETVNEVSGIDLFMLLANQIEKNKIDEADQILESSNIQIDLQYLKSYYKGIIEIIRANDYIALQWFERAAQLNPSFWPAHFHCATILSVLDTVRARKSYIRCAEILEIYIRDNNNKYDFLLESFSPEYFYSICSKNIEKGMKKCQ